jgi:hypothetical protein
LREKGSRGSPDGDESNGEVVVALFTTGGEKLNCDSGDEVGQGSTEELALFH